MLWQFEVLGQPQGKARARVTRFGTYTPEKTVLYENLIKLTFQQKYPQNTITEKYLSMNIEAVLEPPKSTSKKKKQQMIDGIIKPAKKPDLDNICKCVADSLNNICYKDDAQVVEIKLSKRYGEQAKVIVSILEI